VRIKAGRLRHRVLIEMPTDGQDARGGPTLTWSTLATVWARVYERRSGEETDTDQTEAVRMIDVEIRRLAGLTHRCRVTYDSRVWQIVAITNSEERHKGHMIACTEVLTTAEGSI